MKSFADTQAAKVPDQTTNYVKPHHLLGVTFTMVAVEEGKYGLNLVVVKPDEPFGDKYIVDMGNKGTRYAQALSLMNDPDLKKGIEGTFTSKGDFNGKPICKLAEVKPNTDSALWPNMEEVRAEIEYNRSLKLEQDAKTREAQEKDGKFPF